MAEEKLRKAYSLMKQGQTKEAVAIVQNVLKEDKNNVPAWWMMTNLLAEDPERQKKALDRVLALDPNHKLALQLQSKLQGGSAPKQPRTKPQPQPQQPQTDKNQGDLSLSWDKLEARDAGKKQVDEAATSKTVQIVTYGMIIFVIVIAIGLGLMVGIPAYQFSQINNPQDATLRFYNAFLSGDFTTAESLVCTDIVADYTAARDLFNQQIEALKTGFGEGATLNFDFSGVNAEVVTNDGTNATVRLTGEYSISAPNISEEVITATLLTTEGDEEVLRNDNGVWCIAKIQ